MSDQMIESGRARDSRHFSPILRMALFLGVMIHLLGFFIFRVVSNPLPVSEESSAFVTLVETDSASEASELTEQASLFDSAPLFIPSEWSSASGIFASGVVQDWQVFQVFQDFEPDIELMEAVKPSRLTLPRAVDVEQPSDLLHLRYWELFSYFGQKESEIEITDQGNAVAQVTILAEGDDYARSADIHLDVDVSSEQLAVQPIIFILNMAAPGFPVGPPLLQQSSGSDALDRRVIEWLNHPTTLAKLPRGFLRLRVFL